MKRILNVFEDLDLSVSQSFIHNGFGKTKSFKPVPEHNDESMYQEKLRMRMFRNLWKPVTCQIVATVGCCS